MHWDKLTIKNFLSIKEAVIDLNDRGLILIEGHNQTSPKFKSNGSGKTSIFDGIAYVFYDITTKGLKADEVINNKLPKRTNCEVTIEGHDGDDKYIIERYRKHTKHKNKVRLICNGQDISEKSTADTNKKIEKLVGMDYNTFVNSVLFSQRSDSGRFATATDKEKKEILENLVNLQIYAKAQDIAKDKIKAKDAEILEKKREGERLQWELAQVSTLEEQDRKNYENTKNLLIKAELNVKEAEAQFNTYSDGSTERIEKAEKLIVALEKKRDQHKNIDITTETENVDMLRNKAMELQGEIDKLNYQKESIVKDYKKLQTNTTCPVCGSPLDNTHREQELNVKKGELREILMQMKYFQEQINLLQPVYNKALEDLNNKRAVFNDGNAIYRNILQALQNQQKIITDHDNAIMTLQHKIESAKRTLEGLRAVPEPTNRDADRNTIQEKMKAHKAELLALEKEKSSLEDVVKVYSNAGVKSHILDFVTPILNTQGNIYLNTLAGSDMELQFSTQTKNKNGEMSEKFDVKLLNACGGDEYKGNSEGERKRADISISLALKDYVQGKAECNFELYDEVFDALDEVGAENTVALLRERLKKVGSIFVITHSDHLRSLFEKVMTVTKGKDGISRITEGKAE